MKVFKLYLKILKKNFTSVIIYLVIFLSVAILFTQSSSPMSSEFNADKVPITIKNNDEDSLLINNLLEAMNKYSYTVEVEDKDINDAIYFGKIIFAFTIPENFTNDFYNGLNPQISHLKVSGTVYNISLEATINQFLNLVNVYSSQVPSLPEEMMFEAIKTDLASSAQATVNHAGNSQKEMARYYYNYMNYVIFALLLSVVGVITIKIRQFEVKRRMSVSPYSQTRISFEILLGHFLFAMITTTIFVGISYLLFPEGMKDPLSSYYVINAYALTLAVLAISYFISLFTKNDEVVSALSNVLSLGTSFLCGAFVPQFLLGDAVLKVAHILPTYYFIHNNDRIADLEVMNSANLTQIFLFIAVQLLFFVVFSLLSVYVTYRQSRQEQ